MIKTAIFVAGVTCGCVLGSAMTEDQRRRIGAPLRRLSGASATQRIGDSVRHIADSAADRAATKLDGLAEAIEPDGPEPMTRAASTS